MSRIDRAPLPGLDDLVRLAREAGAAIMQVYGTNFDVEHKDDRSPLTQADMASHCLIIDGLRVLSPDIPRLSEESSDVPFEERRRWTRYWLIDPLDGTKEFIKRNGEFTVNIALVEGHRPVLGVVYAPALDLTYFATSADGAFRMQGTAEREPISVRRQVGGPLRIAGSRSHRGNSLDEFLARVGPHEIVSMGSSLKLCLVAEGTADLYPRLGPTSEWDTAAAQCIVEAAGGHVTDTQMRTLQYNTKESFLNPHFFVFGANDRDWSQYLTADRPS